MVGCEVGGAIALGSIPVASGLGILSAAQMFVATGAAGVLFVGFAPPSSAPCRPFRPDPAPG